MIENLVYLVSLVVLILFIERSKILISIKKNIKYSLQFKEVLLDKELNDSEKTKIIKMISKELLIGSLYQLFIFLMVFLFYLIMISFNPNLKAILFSYLGLFEAIIIYLIYIKIRKR